jgi:hypothetical protein
MKVCVCLLGVLRPSLEQIQTNIQRSKEYFEKSYPQYSFDFVVCSYFSKDSFELEAFCQDNHIQTLFLQPISNNEIPKELCLPPPNQNRFRMFYSMSTLLQSLSEKTYDCIIRTRLDTEICSFELKDVKDNIYYSIEDEPGRTCSDNLGYGTQTVMKNIWSLQNAFIDGKNNEEVLYKSIQSLSYTIQPFIFHYKLFQSNDDTFDGVKQWSKRNREWIYDGKNYLRF